jgi:hypothetical protein
MGSTKIGFIWLYRKLHHYVFTTSFCTDKLAHKQITDRFYSSKPLHQYLFSLAGVCTKGFLYLPTDFCNQQAFTPTILTPRMLYKFIPAFFAPTSFYATSFYTDMLLHQRIVSNCFTNELYIIYTILHRLPFRRQTSRPFFTNKLRRQRVLTEKLQRFLHWHFFSQTCFNEAFLIDVV